MPMKNQMNNFDNLNGKTKLSHFILWGSFLFFIVFLTWAYFATLDEVTVGAGKVIPSSKIQTIQNLEGGIVKNILVKEGQTVKKNQILMVLDDTRFSSGFRANQQKKISLQIQIARLDAEQKESPFNPSKNLKKSAPKLVDNATALYKSRINEIKHLKKRQKLLLKEINLTKPLVREGAVSEVELLRLEQGLSELEGKILAFQSATLKELRESTAELSKIQEETNIVKDQLQRTSIRSPVKGIVKQIHVATQGGVIKAGMPLIEIVPLEDTLRIQARIKPADVGFLHPGQPAIVKITAYDFSIYGGMDGKVEHISADTLVDEEGNSFYEVWVRTDRSYLETPTKNLPIIPGMQASVNILTGKKTVLDYLMKPILKAKQNAMRER